MIRSQKIRLFPAIWALLFPITSIAPSGQVQAQLNQKPALIQETRKDPFSLPKGIRLLSQDVPPPREEKKVHPSLEIKSTETKSEEIPLKLKAILMTDHIRLASIDRFIVKVGDLIHGEKVVEIRPDRVILEKEGKKRMIVLDQNPVKLMVEERDSSKKE